MVMNEIKNHQALASKKDNFKHQSFSAVYLTVRNKDVHSFVHTADKKDYIFVFIF